MAPECVPGLLARRNGRVEEGPTRSFIQDLDALPWVSRVYQRFLPIDRYFYSIARHPVVTLISGRGCPHRCQFCVYPQTMHGRRYRRRSPEDIANEMLWVQRNMPAVREIFFEDDTFTVNRAHAERTCHLMLELGVRLPWTANSRCDVDLETLQTMRRANCRLLCVGVESGNQEILDNTGKAIRLERIEQFARDARRAGILIHGCFMVGNPGETPETMEQTFQFARRLNFDTAQFFPLMVYPGTEAYEWARSNGYLRTEDYRRWLDKDGCHNCVIDLPGLPAEELVRFCDQARRRYYLRPRYICGKVRQVVTHPREGKRVIKASKTFFRYLARRG
jgi:anaerobic magnesium-protoporphyrin IX monomethyl ester cyclase